MNDLPQLPEQPPKPPLKLGGLLTVFHWWLMAWIWMSGIILLGGIGTMTSRQAEEWESNVRVFGFTEAFAQFVLMLHGIHLWRLMARQSRRVREVVFGHLIARVGSAAFLSFVAASVFRRPVTDFIGMYWPTFLMAFVWVPYFLISRRVANTFVFSTVRSPNKVRSPERVATSGRSLHEGKTSSDCCVDDESSKNTEQTESRVVFDPVQKDQPTLAANDSTASTDQHKLATTEATAIGVLVGLVIGVLIGLVIGGRSLSPTAADVERKNPSQLEARQSAQESPTLELDSQHSTNSGPFVPPAPILGPTEVGHRDGDEMPFPFEALEQSRDQEMGLLVEGMIVGRSFDNDVYDVAFPGDMLPDLEVIAAERKSAQLVCGVRIAESSPIFVIKLVHFSLGESLGVQQITVTSGQDQQPVTHKFTRQSVTRQSVESGVLEFATLLPFYEPSAGKFLALLRSNPACNVEVRGSNGFTTFTPGKTARLHCERMVKLYEALRREPSFVSILQRNALGYEAFQQALLNAKPSPNTFSPTKR